MSKERLEEIKLNWTLTGFSGTWDDDIYWLIEQAERVQELEKRLKIYQRRSWVEDYEKVAKQNKCYREVLSIISANLPLDSREYYVSIARKALEGEE